MAFPAGTCTTCQAINLDALLATDRNTRRGDRLSLLYHQGLNPELVCPVCRLVLSCLPRNYQTNSLLRLMLQVDDLISNGGIYRDRNVREIQMSTYGEQVGGGRLRIYADEGMSHVIRNLDCATDRNKSHKLTGDRHRSGAICDEQASTTIELG